MMRQTLDIWNPLTVGTSQEVIKLLQGKWMVKLLQGKWTVQILCEMRAHPVRLSALNPS
jgi:hypothetical protein